MMLASLHDKIIGVTPLDKLQVNAAIRPPLKS
jgi:hypothetical protein